MENVKIPKCPICSNDCEYSSFSHQYKPTCKSQDCKERKYRFIRKDAMKIDLNLKDLLEFSKDSTSEDLTSSEVKDIIPVDQGVIPGYEYTDEIRDCFDDMNAGHNIFISGPGGVGKSFLIKEFIAQTKKNVVVLAPTGIAALNAGGSTIHSFFNFPVPVWKMRDFTRENNEIYKKTDIIIIDEISMVRADMLDIICKFLMVNGKNPGYPFGGIQMIFVGDLYQLPPVLTDEESDVFFEHYTNPYVFGARMYKTLKFKYHILTKIFRQSDSQFIEFLARVRVGKCLQNDFKYLKDRIKSEVDLDTTTVLASTNAVVDTINDDKLATLETPLFISEAELGGNATFNTDKYPVPKNLKLKIGAKVVFLVNDPARRWVNGTIGYIENYGSDDNGDYLQILINNTRSVEVEKHVFQDVSYKHNKEDDTVTTEVKGFMKQYPIRLAYAVTIHKSQGLTLDRLHLDLKRGCFAHGQFYVALSRCRTLEGLSLSHEVKDRNIIVDSKVTEFYQSLR